MPQASPAIIANEYVQRFTLHLPVNGNDSALPTNIKRIRQYVNQYLLGSDLIA